MTVDKSLLRQAAERVRDAAPGNPTLEALRHLQACFGWETVLQLLEDVNAHRVRHDIDQEIRAAVADYPNTNKRPPEVTIGSWWFAPIWGVNQVLDIRVSWCGDTEVKLSKAGWWDARCLRRDFDRYTAQPCAYSDSTLSNGVR